MPTTSRPQAASVSRHLNRDQQQQDITSSSHTVATASTIHNTSNTSPLTQSRLPEVNRSRTEGSEAQAVVDLTESLSSDSLPDGAFGRHFADDNSDDHTGFGAWTGEDLAAAVDAWQYIFQAANDYNSADDEDFEDDEDLDEDLSDEDVDDEEIVEEEDEDDLDEEDEVDHEFLNDGDLWALAEEDSLFVEDDPFLGGIDDDFLSSDPAGPGFRSEDFLNAITANNLSSPSSYPSFIHGPSLQLALDQARPNLAAENTSTAPAVQRNPIAAPSRTNTQLTDSTAESAATVDEQDPDLEDVTPGTSFSEDMPPTTRRGSHHGSHSSPPAKRRRTSTTHRVAPAKKPDPVKLDDDDLFGDPPPRITESVVDDMPAIDLTAATEVPDELKEPVRDNRIKLAAFQCVICMDDVTSLTVTHCGHLYCAACLHSSLHTGATKGRCPMCRQKLDIKARSSYTSKTKGYWPLELKIMTSTRKGKRKADT
ncbi:zinc finger, c3HC4 type (RING finger) domain-containing protein [Sarocladium implicatum]|nr:zinc finger, c3HC4 type (RING finger) domain-containing protein [Sarocladium implicatum]